MLVTEANTNNIVAWGITISAKWFVELMESSGDFAMRYREEEED